jgi:CubicO group peptidase (beta-lactamase class C family)
VIEAFADNFAESGEQGAALAVYRHGEPLLNIWAGTRSNAVAEVRDEPWQEDTRVNIFSASKGLVALSVLQLVARGELMLDKPVAEYWPEFAAAGKSAITLRQILCHRSGLSAFQARRQEQDIFEWATITGAVAAETPWWEPGTQQGYSPFIYGWILGELVRRVSGYDSFNAYFQAQVAQPLALQCAFGVLDEQLATLADTAPLKRSLGELVSSAGADSASLGKLMKADPRGVTNRAFTNPMSLMISTNTRAWRQAQIPAANAHASALDLATIYGSLAAGKLLPESHLPLCWQEQSAELDQVLGLPLRFGCGFMLSQDRPDCRFGRGARAFGHPGAGGSLGFADPDYHLGFGYVTARMGQSLLIDQRVVRLIDTLYALPEVRL